MAFNGQKLTLSGAPDELIPVVSPTAGEPTAVATFIAGSQVMAGTASGLSITQIGPATAVNTPVTFAMSPYTVVSSDIVLMCATSGGAISVVLPTAASSSNRVIQVVDASGSAATNNVTVTVSGAGLINGSATYVINLAYGAASFFSSGAFWVVTNNTASSGGGYATGVRQIVRASTGVFANLVPAVSIPRDNTIPQIGEGSQYFSVSITPQSATSRLYVFVTAMLSPIGAADSYTGAIFRDAIANAIGSMNTVVVAANETSVMTFFASVVSGSTAATTFQFRASRNSALALALNGQGVNALFGGNASSGIVVIEAGA